MTTPATILVVDDEHDLVHLVRYNLLKEGYQVVTAFDGTSAWKTVQATRPDLIILDLMLPDQSGFELCRQIKADANLREIPVIMLTARSAEQDRIRGFESGAEDYVLKPFSPKELVLRVKAMLGRMRKTQPAQIQAGKMTIIPDERRVLIDQLEVTLTTVEFDLLVCLAGQPNKVKTREQLLEEVWAEDSAEVLDRAVDASIKRLRAKLGEERDRIETIRGLGYRFRKGSSPDSVASAELS